MTWAYAEGQRQGHEWVHNGDQRHHNRDAQVGCVRTSVEPHLASERYRGIRNHPAREGFLLQAQPLFYQGRGRHPQGTVVELATLSVGYVRSCRRKTASRGSPNVDGFECCMEYTTTKFATTDAVSISASDGSLPSGAFLSNTVATSRFETVLDGYSRAL
jgi:hypothetical protein